MTAAVSAFCLPLAVLEELVLAHRASLQSHRVFEHDVRQFMDHRAAGEDVFLGHAVIHVLAQNDQTPLRNGERGAVFEAGYLFGPVLVTCLPERDLQRALGIDAEAG